eukprot:1190988-Prorocentrum_minimum.AAC.1
MPETGAAVWRSICFSASSWPRTTTMPLPWLPAVGLQIQIASGSVPPEERATRWVTTGCRRRAGKRDARPASHPERRRQCDETARVHAFLTSGQRVASMEYSACQPFFLFVIMACIRFY